MTIARVRLLIPAIVVVGSAGLLMQPLNAHSASRYALTGAIWDDHSLAIDGYPLGLDRSVLEGQTFSDKAPGQPVWALPVYGAYRLLGGEPARIPQATANIGLWLVTVWSATIPAALLVLVMVWVCRPLDSRLAVTAGLFTWSGTLLLPFSSALYGHVLSALLLFAAFTVLRSNSSVRVGGPLLAGLLAGLAVVTEYTTVLGVLVLALWLAHNQRGKLLGFVGGGLSPLAALAIYNFVAFGSPSTLSYQLNAFHGPAESVRSVLHMFTGPSATNLLHVFFGPRGFLLATPIVLAGLWGLFRLVRTGLARDLGAIGLAMFLVFLMIPMFWANPWGGDSPGPRYMTPAMAFLAPGVAYALRQRRGLTVGLGAVSLISMGLATLTNPFVAGPGDTGGLGAWIELALARQWVPNMSGEPWGAVAAIALAGLALPFLRTSAIRPAAGSMSTLEPSRVEPALHSS